MIRIFPNLQRSDFSFWRQEGLSLGLLETFYGELDVVSLWLILQYTTLLVQDIVISWIYVLILLCWGGLTPKGIYIHPSYLIARGGISKKI